MKYKLGLLREPVAPPVNLLTIYKRKCRKVVQEPIGIAEFQYLWKWLGIKNFQSKEQSRVWHRNYYRKRIAREPDYYIQKYKKLKEQQHDAALKKQLQRRIKSVIHCRRCHKILPFPHTAKSLKKHNQQYHAY